MKLKLNEKIIDFLMRSTLPIMLGGMIANLVIKCYYYERAELYTVLYIAASVGLFLLFDQLRKRRFIGPLIYIALLAGFGFLASRLMSMAWQDSHIVFTDWFYLNRDTAGFNLEYFLVVYLFGGFFLTSIIYYFTQVRFRSLGLMLCLLFPFVIYAKRADIMSGFEIALLITVFLAIVVYNRQQQIPKSVRPIKDLSLFVSLALFVSFAGAVAMLLPKPTVRSVLERDSHAFDITPMNSPDGDYTRYTRVSSARYGTSYTNKVLFYAETDAEDDIYYLKRQSFDNFYEEIWHNDRGAEKYTNYDYYSRVNINRQDYYDALKALAETGNYTQYGLDPKIFDLPTMQQKSFRVFDESFKGAYVPAPSGVIAKTFSESMSAPYYLYGDGEISVKNVNRDYDYTVTFYPETSSYINYARRLEMTGEYYYTMLKAAYEKGDLTDDTLIEQYVLAHDNYTSDVEYTDRMRELAFQITDQYRSDYAKANAICKYFENNGYVYDDAFTPDNTSIDYFIFEGKTGVCTSYATAMTILARIVGLPARYVEGFAAYERNENNELVIRDSHAHAYVEVFIPGAGWCVFDPTVAGYAIDRSGSDSFSFASIMDYLSRALVFVAVAFFAFVIMMMDRILELVFRIRQRHFSPADKIVRLYARTVKLLEHSGGDRLEAYTPNMLCEYSLENNTADISPIARLFERSCFGGFAPEEQEYDTVYAHYKSIYKQLRKRPQPPKGRRSQKPAAAGN